MFFSIQQMTHPQNKVIIILKAQQQQQQQQQQRRHYPSPPYTGAGNEGNNCTSQQGGTHLKPPEIFSFSITQTTNLLVFAPLYCIPLLGTSKHGYQNM